MTEETLIDLVEKRGLMVSWDEEGHCVREYLPESPIIFKLSDFFLRQCTPELITHMIDTYLLSPPFKLLTWPKEEEQVKSRISRLFSGIRGK